MSQATSIEWTDLTWNPTHGCSKVSPGCAHCYAETLSLRYKHTLKPWTPENAAENVLLKPHKLREPLSNSKPWRGLGAAAAAAGMTRGKLVFVNSTSDLFHEQVPDEFIAAVFGVMAAAEQHTFQILTKRPERMKAWFEWYEAEARDRELWDVNGVLFGAGLEHMPADLGFQEARQFGVELGEAREIPWPLQNVWLGVSIENRRFVHRADLLRETPAAMRFISAEPLLGPLVPTGHGCFCFADVERADRPWQEYDGPALSLQAIDWLIVGGESGPEHRRVDERWVRDLRDAAQHSGTAFFFKQWGGLTPKSGGRELDGRTWGEFPASKVPVATG